MPESQVIFREDSFHIMGVFLEGFVLLLKALVHSQGHGSYLYITHILPTSCTLLALSWYTFELDNNYAKTNMPPTILYRNTPSDHSIDLKLASLALPPRKTPALLPRNLTELSSMLKRRIANREP